MTSPQVLTAIVVFGCGTALGPSTPPLLERAAHPRTAQRIAWERELVTCVESSTAELARCEDCPSYTPRWSAEQARLYIRNCIDPYDPVIGEEIQAWADGEYGRVR